MQTKPFLALAALALLLSAPQAFGQYPPSGYGQPPGYGPQMGPQMAPMGAQMAPGINPYAMGVQQAAFLSGGGKSNCDSCGKSDCGKEGKGCCSGWRHCWAVYGDLLYLRARDADVAYAVENNGPALPNVPIQLARIGVVDQEEDPGFRFGIQRAIDDCTSVGIQYTMFETSRTDRTDQVSGVVGSVIRSLVAHPSSLLANSSSIFAEATHDLSFDLVDFDIRRMLAYCDDYQISTLVGFRYGNLEQQFNSRFPITGQETVVTDIDFDGAGPRLGLEGEWYTRNRRWLTYGKFYTSFLAGEFKADLQQGQNFDASVVDTNWKAGRVVTILDLEMGLGWQNCDGTWRITAGYMLSAWLNVVKTDEWINSVQRNNFVDLEDQMTFDGLVTRIEGRF